MPIVTFTDDFISNGLLCPPDRRRIEYVDANRTGLYIEVRNTSPGQGTWYLRYKDGAGKTCHSRIGRTGDIDLEMARAKAKELRAKITLGEDPREQAKAKQAAMPFTAFFEDLYLPYAKERKRSWRKDDGLYKLRLKPEFGKLRLDQITQHQVQTFHTGLRTAGLSGATCDHHLKIIRAALNLAVDWGLLERNPAARVKQFNLDNKLERYLNDEELGRLLHVLHTDANQPICRIVLWLLATGCRLNEALTARWDHIDREHRVWRIPALNSKSKRIRAVPLNQAAIEVLDQLDTEGKFDQLFINQRRKKPYRNIAKVFDRLRRQAGLPNLRIHDLRHQFASQLVSAGKSLFTVQQILGHSDPSVTMRYSHLSTAALQDAAEAASDALTRARQAVK